MIKRGLNPRLAEIGKIKIGGKGEHRKSKKGVDYQLPTKFDHFVVTTTERNKQTGNFLQDIEVMKKLGTAPKEISIRLVFDDIDMNFYTTFASYQGKKLFCKGDGEIADRQNDKMKCDPETCKIFKNDDPKSREPKCKVSGILSCMIKHNMEFGGVYRFRTHSYNSVSNILASLQFISEQTNGVLQGLPLKLKMLKKTTEEHGDINIVTIVLDGIEITKMRELAMNEYQNRLQLGIDMKQIESKAKRLGFMKVTDTPHDIKEEFYNTEPVNVTPPEPVEPETVEKEKKAINSEELGKKIEKKAEEKKPSEEKKLNKTFSPEKRPPEEEKTDNEQDETLGIF